MGEEVRYGEQCEHGPGVGMSILGSRNREQVSLAAEGQREEQERKRGACSLGGGPEAGLYKVSHGTL